MSAAPVELDPALPGGQQRLVEDAQRDRRRRRPRRSLDLSGACADATRRVHSSAPSRSPPSLTLACAAPAAAAGRPDHAALAGPARHALHRLQRDPGHRHRQLRRRRRRRRLRRARTPPTILITISGPAVDATGGGPGLLRLADLLPVAGRRHAAGHRRAGARDRRLRRQDAAGHADRGDARRAGPPAGRRPPRPAPPCAAPARWRVPLSVSGLVAARSPPSFTRRRGEGRPRALRRAVGPAGDRLPGADAAPRRVGRGRLLDRRHRLRRHRHRDLRRRQRRLGLRPPAGLGRPPLAVPRRTPSSTTSSASPSVGRAEHLQARRARATTSARSPATACSRSAARSGALPPRFPMTVTAPRPRHQDAPQTTALDARRRARGRQPDRLVAAGLRRDRAVAQAAYAILHGSPINTSGGMCVAWPWPSAAAGWASATPTSRPAPGWPPTAPARCSASAPVSRLRRGRPPRSTATASGRCTSPTSASRSASAAGSPRPS